MGGGLIVELVSFGLLIEVVIFSVRKIVIIVR